jgi:predicted regulator of Ras-like GTPase activity (Roadblock/LC7/MglB family)
VKGPQLARAADTLQEPIREFVDEARVRLALVISGSGQVLAQHGFNRSYEVVNVAALAAAAHASARVLAELAGAGRWHHLHHAGRQRQIFLSPLRTPALEAILVAIFDGDSSLGVVRLFTDRLQRRVAGLPAFARPVGFTDATSFERELEAGLARIFSPDQPEKT